MSPGDFNGMIFLVAVGAALWLVARWGEYQHNEEETT